MRQSHIKNNSFHIIYVSWKTKTRCSNFWPTFCLFEYLFAFNTGRNVILTDIDNQYDYFLKKSKKDLYPFWKYIYTTFCKSQCMVKKWKTSLVEILLKSRKKSKIRRTAFLWHKSTQSTIFWWFWVGRNFVRSK